MKNTNVFRLFGIIAFVVVIGLSMTTCDLNKEETKEETTLFEGSWGAFNDDKGEFDFKGDKFEYSIIRGACREGTFTSTASQITFNSTQEFISNQNDIWSPITSPPRTGPVGAHVNFLDSGSPVNYKFERNDDGKVYGITIGGTFYRKD